MAVQVPLVARRDGSVSDDPPTNQNVADRQRWFKAPKLARLCRAGVEEIERLFASGATDADISRLMGITGAGVWAQRRLWKRRKAKESSES
jgi:hypothetical protein